MMCCSFRLKLVRLRHCFTLSLRWSFRNRPSTVYRSLFQSRQGMIACGPSLIPGSTSNAPTTLFEQISDYWILGKSNLPTSAEMVCHSRRLALGGLTMEPGDGIWQQEMAATPARRRC